MNKAKEILLSDESLTCVLCDGKNVLKSSYSGIRPMLEFISKGTDFSEYSAAADCSAIPRIMYSCLI